jgi:hypothetical protein
MPSLARWRNAVIGASTGSSQRMSGRLTLVVRTGAASAMSFGSRSQMTTMTPNPTRRRPHSENVW